MVDEAASLTINFDSMLYYDKEAIKEISFYELGFNEVKKFIATNMFKKYGYRSISSILGLSIDEINKLKMEIQKGKY